jgi:hypothetical protein
VPVLFAYGGWHTTTFMAAEVCDVRRNVPRGLVLGVLGVTVLYLGVNLVCVRVLGAGQLAVSGSPAADVMRQALGAPGAAILSAGIAVSAIGFLSQAVLTSPRVYYAMARDGLFFPSVAWIHPRTRVPILAVLLQGAFAILIAVSGTFHQILNVRHVGGNGVPGLDGPEPVHPPAQGRGGRHGPARRGAGSPGDHVTLHGGGRGRGGRPVLAVSREQRDRTWDRRGGASGVCLLSAEEARAARRQGGCVAGAENHEP